MRSGLQRATLLANCASVCFCTRGLSSLCFLFFSQPLTFAFLCLSCCCFRVLPFDLSIRCFDSASISISGVMRMTFLSSDVACNLKMALLYITGLASRWTPRQSKDHFGIWPFSSCIFLYSHLASLSNTRTSSKIVANKPQSFTWLVCGAPFWTSPEPALTVHSAAWEWIGSPKTNDLTLRFI